MQFLISLFLSETYSKMDINKVDKTLHRVSKSTEEKIKTKGIQGRKALEMSKVRDTQIPVVILAPLSVNMFDNCYAYPETENI